MVRSFFVGAKFWALNVCVCVCVARTLVQGSCFVFNSTAVSWVKRRLRGLQDPGEGASWGALWGALWRAPRGTGSLRPWALLRSAAIALSREVGLRLCLQHCEADEGR